MRIRRGPAQRSYREKDPAPHLCTITGMPTKTRANPEQQLDPRALKWTADAYEQARDLRVGAAARIIAALEDGEIEEAALERTLRAIGSGDDDGPSPVLARVYRRNLEQEWEMERILSEMLHDHPGWVWLREVPGVRISDGARLLARLDVRRAPTPSSFWSYCGLATVPGARYRCEACGTQRTQAQGTPPPATHTVPGQGVACPGRFRVVGKDGARVPQPKSGAGERPGYDEEAKRTCYSIGTGLLEAAHGYAEYYREQRTLLDGSRPGWPAGRKHMTALRKMQKLFLAHLWIVWREAEALPLTEPSPGSPSDARWSLPWAMTGAPRKRWTSRERVLPQLRIRG